MSLGSLSLWAPHPARCVVGGWKDHPRVWGCGETVVPAPSPRFQGPSGRGGRLSRGEVTFHLPCLFLGEKKSAGSAPSQRLSFVPPARDPAVFFTLILCMCFRPLSVLVGTISRLSDEFCVGVCEQWEVEIAPGGEERKG